MNRNPVTHLRNILVNEHGDEVTTKPINFQMLICAVVITALVTAILTNRCMDKHVESDPLFQRL